ncbi:MAG: hypothetical protein ACOYOA_13970 [Saprospiraceae bacterium]
MQILKSGKEEIIFLLSKSIEKYTKETGQEIVKNTNRKNYEVLAIVLSEISNQLPARWEELGTDPYSPEIIHTGREYPFRKYDITGGQIKDALNGVVSNPRSFLIDACYIYLYGIGRKAFEQNPLDDNLLEKSVQSPNQAGKIADQDVKDLPQRILALEAEKKLSKKRIAAVATIAIVLGITLLTFIWQYFQRQEEWKIIKNDMNVLPYLPDKTEIASLEGVWLCYTGSPQARISDPNRYHKVVPNLINVEYKNGYFTFLRYGASFNHVGYMQYEGPGIVSVHSRIKNSSNRTESPRHSLLNLNTRSKYLAAVSASWNFDIGDKNKMIGIREIYTKLGTGGRIEEVINEVENAICQCKVIRWYQDNNVVKTFYLKNELLDALSEPELKSLIDEHSILLNIPQDGLLISKDSSGT